MTRLSEIALIAEVVTLGSEKAFEQLVKAHQEAVRRFLVRLTNGHLMLADDLAQETFIRAWQGLTTFRNSASFRTWLLRIAYHTFLDEKRRQGSVTEQQLLDTSEGERRCLSSSEGLQRDSSTTDSWALRHDIDIALATLSEAERTCVVLQCIEGRNIKDIATITAMNENTVKSHLLRGKRNLAHYLRKHGYNG